MQLHSAFHEQLAWKSGLKSCICAEVHLFLSGRPHIVCQKAAVAIYKKAYKGPSHLLGWWQCPHVIDLIK